MPLWGDAVVAAAMLISPLPGCGKGLIAALIHGRSFTIVPSYTLKLMLRLPKEKLRPYSS